MLDLSNLFAILVIFAGVATLQFFHGRRLNLLLMRNFVITLENTIKPKDQIYTWLGGYIGFKAEYDIDDAVVEKIEVTLTLLPRHSIMYLPISLLTLKSDRLFIVAKCRFPLRGDVHAIKKGTYTFSKGIDNEIEYKSESLKVKGEEFQIYYKRKEDKEELAKLLKELPIEFVKHISITPSTGVVYAFVRPNREVIEKIIPAMFEMARKFSKL